MMGGTVRPLYVRGWHCTSVLLVKWMVGGTVRPLYVPQYNPILNQIYVPWAGVDTVRDTHLFHELVHAFDDQNNIHLGTINFDWENAEALAYTAEFLLEKYRELAVMFQRFHDMDIDASCEVMQSQWRSFFNSIDRPVLEGDIIWQNGSRPGHREDVIWAETVLGVEFSAEAISACFFTNHCIKHCELPAINTQHERVINGGER